MRARHTILLLATACNQIYGIEPTRLPDALPDAVGCSERGFMVPMPLDDPDSRLEISPTLSADGLELYFSADVGSTFRLHRATRATTDEPFANVVELPLLAGRPTLDASLTRDDLTMVFVSRAADNLVLESRRAAVGEPFSEPIIVTGLEDIGGGAQSLDLSYDGLTIYYANIAGELWVASRREIGRPFEGARPLATGVVHPSISPDHRELFYNSPDYPTGNTDLYRRVRASVADDFSAEMSLFPGAQGADLAQDASTLILSSLGRLQIYRRQCP